MERSVFCRGPSPAAPFPISPLVAAIVSALLVLGSVGMRRGETAETKSTAEEKQEEAAGEGAVLWADRAVLQRLTRAEELLRRERYAEASRLLGTILEAPEDYFIRPQTKSGDALYGGLKAEAHRLIGSMPRAGRESYELQYGARARQMLAQAVQTNNSGTLADVSRQFFHTQAGYEATLLFGLDELDHGRPLAAALTLQRLRSVGTETATMEPLLSMATAAAWLQAGESENSVRVLREFRRQWPSRTVTLNGKDVPLFDDREDPAAWLVRQVGPGRVAPPQATDGWLSDRGDPARNRSVAASCPLLSLRWRVPNTDDPSIEEYLRQRSQGYRDRTLSDAPALQPLVVGDVALMRSVRNLVAVDFLTGKRLWEVPVDERLDQVLSGGGTALEQSPHLGVGVEQRLWDDLTYGRLSSDGQRVYSIEDLGLGAGMHLGRQVILPNGRRQADPAEPKAFNRLMAHDIRTGKLKWQVGGSPEGDALPLAETFFLGPPLALANRLYAMAEVREEIRLLALDAQTGAPLWSQQLAAAEQSVHFDATRRLAGISPSYADGILVCPTGTGSVVAVELATRWLLWRYSYPRSRESTQGNHLMMQRMAMARGGEPAERWVDGNPVIARGLVVVGPAESDELHCLGLADGKLHWKQRRQRDLYLACINEGRVALVGGREVRAVNLADGTPAWDGRVVSLPEGAATGGRGVWSGQFYYLPLSTAGIAVIDVVEGCLQQVVAARDGAMPGNLVAYHGRVLSQGVEGLECYYQIDALREQVQRRLAGNPRDAEALALSGEVLLHEGKTDEAIGAFRRSLAIAPELRTRALLRDCLLDGLRRDFARYRDTAGEIEGLLDDDLQRARFLRLMASGLQETGDWRSALEHYRRMIEMDEGRPLLEPVGRSLSMRRPQWVQGQLVSLRKTGPAEAARALDQLIDSNWQKAQGRSGPESVRRFLATFDRQPQAERARQVLVDRLKQSNRPLEAELLLWPQLASSDRVVAARTTAELAGILAQAQRPSDAAVLYRRLQDRFGDVRLADGRTGREVVEGLDEETFGPRRAPVEWPKGVVEVSQHQEQRERNPSYGRSSLDIQRGREPFFRDVRMYFDQTSSSLQARDGLGRLRSQVSLLELQDQSNRVFYHHSSPPAISARGHLMAVLLQNRLLAIDTLRAEAPAILWQKDLQDLPAAALRTQFRVRARGFFGAGISFASPPPGQVLGPLTDRYLCYQRLRDCVAVDPIDGRPLWVRHDLPPGSTLLGDEEFVIVAPPEQGEAMVLDARSGALLGRRRMPQADRQLAMLGRDVLLWASDGEGTTLQRFDLWRQKPVWGPMRFPHETKVHLANDEAIGLLAPDGHFRLVGLEDGRTIIDYAWELQERPLGVVVLPLGNEYVVVAQLERPRASHPFSTQALPGMTLYRPIARGLVLAFDRQGKVLWPRAVPIANQHLLLDQPADLPVVISACQLYQSSGTRAGNQVTTIHVIDKRTGRVLLNKDFPHHSNAYFEISGQLEKRAVDIIMQPQPRQEITLRLTFTDRPWPSGPSELNDAPAPAEEPLSGGWNSRILQGIFRALSRPANPRDAAPETPQPAPQPKR